MAATRNQKKETIEILKESTISTDININEQKPQPNDDSTNFSENIYTNPSESNSDNTNSHPTDEFEQLFDEISKEDIKSNFPTLNKNRVPPEQISTLTNMIAMNLKIPKTRAMIAMMLLFLKGAANASAPDSLSILIGKEGISLTKGKLKDFCKSVCDHTYLRRIAEALALKIGNFAFENDMNGDLFKALNNRCLSQFQRPLTPKEAAFASTFTRDGIININEVAESEILAQLLAEDYQFRLSNSISKSKQSNKSKKSK